MRRVSRIIILTFIFIQVLLAGYADIDPHNGVAYILLPKDLAGIHGVYRLNDYTDPYDPIVPGNGRRMFDLNFGGAVVVNGLAVNQSSKVYLFVGPNVTGEYAPVEEIGWIPAGSFEEDSPAFIKLIGQPFSADQVSQDANSGLGNLCFPWGTTNYDNDFWDYGPETWPYTHNRYYKGAYTDDAGNSYSYKFDPYAPASHKNLPLWNGPGAGSAGIKHPTDPYKVVLPNGWGGISWYAFGSPKAPAAHVGKLMDGKDGRPLLDQYDFRLSWTNRGNYSPYNDAIYISAVVKRVYEKRDRSLDLYAYMDNVVPPVAPPYSIYPTLEAGNVLTATDLKITEMYGKSCADGCIPGGEMNPEAVGKIESCVQVFTSTTGRRYGFNPYGKKAGPYGANDAALRAVHNGATYNLDINSSNIKNINYFTDFLDVPIESATILGVSSNFQTPATPITTSPDHLYASIANKFCIQDSWWGNGGVAYEYFSKDTETAGMTFKAGHIYRLNYLETSNPVPEDVGYFAGDIDAISVDGHGNLYILYTELDVPNDPVWPDELGLPQGPDLDEVNPKDDGNPIVAHPDFLEISEWFRPGDGVPDFEIAGPEESGDYIKVKFKQRVKKVCRKYTPSAGGGFSASTVEERGSVDAGFDAIRRDLVYNGDGSFSWLGLWHHDFGIGSRTANIDAEFAVVNIAERPSNIEGDLTYSVCRYDRVPSTEVIAEDTELTFKVEGYRPYGEDGNIQHLVHVGAVPDVGEVYVNMIPPYETRDEDGDGYKGGFPSGMFENNSAYKLDVKWHVDLIDPRAGANYTDSQVIQKWRNQDPEPGLQKLFKFKFPQPGTYAVYATFDYSFFKYEDLAEGDRPDELKNHIGTRSIGAGQVQKILYHVQSPSNTVSDGYITNITLDTSAIFEPGVNSAGQNGYGMIEDRAPASLSFTFDAQFVRDANRNTGGASYQTFDGIGVWDYGVGPHVYNWNSDGSVNLNEYNPGKKKFANEVNTPGKDKFECGTRVDEAPNPDDLAAITYRLLIYPPYINDSGSMVEDDPIVLGTGTCRLASIEDLTDQKYRITMQIPPDNLKKIRTPIDPYKYKVRLELEYPRVTWHEHKHSDAPGTVTEVQYRSIIPGTPLRGLITNEPTTLPGADVGKDETPGLFAGNDYWEICARDVTIFQNSFEGIEFDTEAEVTQIATHTTGDPVPPCQIKMSLVDNNPKLMFDESAPFFSEMKLRYELPVSKRNLISKTDNHFADGVQSNDFGPYPSSPYFYASDSYKLAASFTYTIDEYGGETGSSDLFDPNRPFQHWIGSLSFSLEGKLYDGLGATQTSNLSVPHVFEKDSVDERLRTYACGLVRYDNDPPSIRVNLVSQADNRRWEITLLENNNDSVANPSTLGQLASSTLTAKCYKINDDSDTLLDGEILVPGSSDFPIEIAEKRIVNVASYTDSDLLAAMPVVRRSSRLMISVGLADNVDYQDLASAAISVTEYNDSGSKALLPTRPLTSTAQPNDDIEASLKFDRGRFFVDMPMKVMPDQSITDNSCQVSVSIYAEDSSGNRRVLTIPVKIVESTFDARVLESSEKRD